MTTIRAFIKSRKFLFTAISVVIFTVGIWVFKQPPLELAKAITTLTAPYLMANVAVKAVDKIKNK
jgi:hypothetical protein